MIQRALADAENKGSLLHGIVLFLRSIPCAIRNVKIKKGVSARKLLIRISIGYMKQRQKVLQIFLVEI
jgi:hypothetical protein